jgi:hypothetical protein
VLLGTGDGTVGNDDEWYGLTVRGAVGKSEADTLFDWNLEYAARDVDGPAESRKAYRAIVSKDLADATGGFLQRASLTRTDADGAMHINPGDFNTAGLLHQFGGAWRSELITNQVNLKLKPVEKLDVEVTYVNFERDAGDNNEVDIMVGRPLGEGVHAWVGYGRDEDDREVGFAQLTLFF